MKNDIKGEEYIAEDGMYIVKYQKTYLCSQCAFGDDKTRVPICSDCVSFKIKSMREKNPKEKYIGKMKRRYNSFKRGALARRVNGIPFHITLEQFERMYNSNCRYCGSKDNLGMDRVNSKKGYTIDNVVSCCPVCNIMKGIRSEEFFINHIRKISDWNSLDLIPKGKKYSE